MRCQFCGKRLPILRKLTDGEFCSPAHRRSYQEEQERQALSRLLEASQLGASRRATELKTVAATATGAGLEVLAAATKGKAKVSAPAPGRCESFFPLVPQECRPATQSGGHNCFPNRLELLMLDRPAQRSPHRIQRRLAAARSQPVPLRAELRQAGPGAFGRAATQPLASLGASPAMPQRRGAELRASLRLRGRQAMPLSLRRAPANLASHLRESAYGRPFAGQVFFVTPRLQAHTEWAPPRMLTARRMADRAQTSLACRDRAIHLAQPPLVFLDAAATAVRAWRPSLVPALGGAPAQSPLLRPEALAGLDRSATAVAAGCTEPVAWGRRSSAMPDRQVKDNQGRLPRATHLLRLALALRNTSPSPLNATLAAHQTRIPLEIPKLDAGKGRARRLRGVWLQRLPEARPAQPTSTPATEGMAPLRFAPQQPQLASGLRASPAKPGALRQLLALPPRFCPEPRCQADRGRLLFLAVKAKQLRTELALAPPKRKPVAVALDVKATTNAARLFTALGIRAMEAPAAVAVAPLVPLRPSVEDMEMAASRLPVLGGAPRASRKLLRLNPQLVLVNDAEMASFGAARLTSQLRSLPPRVALRPDPARTRKKGFVPDILRQLPFRPASPLQRVWRHAPADLRWVALAIPVVLGLAWWSLAPKSRPSDIPVPGVEASLPVVAGAGGTVKPVPARATAGVPAPAQSAPVEPAEARSESFFDTYLGSFREKVRARAAVEVSDDFRSGLSAWEGDRGWSEGWSYDQAGFVLPGSLALLRPTTNLTDYTFEFLGMIDRKALSWVFRAKDTRNYYAGKLVVLQGGPLPSVAFVRYRVVNGREEGRKVIMLPQQVRTETLYRVKIDVSGNDFTTSVLGNIVDTFTDTVHSRGGVGLFSARGEQAKIRWVEISHQYDTFGRLCAFLAPPRLESREAVEPVANRKVAPKKRGSAKP